MIRNKLIEICSDFPEWPERWIVVESDLEYGNQLLVEIRPFAESLAGSGLSKKTIKRHLDNLWLLGGEIIRAVSMGEEYSIPASKKLRESVGPDGGPLCRHLYGKAQINSFDSTCRKLNKFLISTGT
jgi:hypothetical protein